jgi:hypothetical protein
MLLKKPMLGLLLNRQISACSDFWVQVWAKVNGGIKALGTRRYKYVIHRGSNELQVMTGNSRLTGRLLWKLVSVVIGVSDGTCGVGE